MEHTPQPTPEQLKRRTRAEELMENINAGTITSPDQIDPRETSAEVVQMARKKLRRLGHLARINTSSGL